MSLSASRRRSASVALALPARFSSNTSAVRAAIALVGAAHGAGQVIGAEVQLQRPRLGRHRLGVAAGGRHASRGRGARRADGGRAARRSRRPRPCPSLTRPKSSTAASRPRNSSSGMSSPTPAKRPSPLARGADPRSLRQLARVDGAEERLVRRVGDRLLEGAQRAEELRLDLRVASAARATAWSRGGRGRARGRAPRSRPRSRVRACAPLLNRIAVEDRRLADLRRDGVQRPLEQLPAPGALLRRARARGLRSGTGCRAWARCAARRRAWRSRRGCTAARWGSRRAPVPS